MKTYISILALAALPACMGGGGGGGGVPTTQSQIDVVANNQMGAVLDNARSNSLPDIEYNSVVAGVAQDHAQDMFDRNYLSTFDQGTTGGPTGGRTDMGDDLVAIGYTWDEIVQMVSQGEKASMQVLFDELIARDINSGVEGDLGEKLGFAMSDDIDYEFFGIGKAGSGSNQKWALIVVDPSAHWSDR